MTRMTYSETITQLSPTYRARTEQALAQTITQLNKELGYSEDLQNEVLVGFYRNHIERLQRLLTEGESR